MATTRLSFVTCITHPRPLSLPLLAPAARFEQFTISRRPLFATCITHPPPLSRPLLAHGARSEECTFTDSVPSENPNKPPLRVASVFGVCGLVRMAAMFPGMDYEHWDIYMHEAGGKGATKEKIIDCYIKTLAKVVGSDCIVLYGEEEAKKKIYKVNCDPSYPLWFGCQLDSETAYKLEGLPEVSSIAADYYGHGDGDYDTNDYVRKHHWCESLVNGKIDSSMVRLFNCLLNEKDRPIQ